MKNEWLDHLTGDRDQESYMKIPLMWKESIQEIGAISVAYNRRLNYRDTLLKRVFRGTLIKVAPT